MFEALISLNFILLISSMFVLSTPLVNQSLYLLQLSEDVWRVLYLRGDLSGLEFSSGNLIRDRLQADLELISSLTGHCVFVSGVRAHSCTDSGEEITSIQRTLMIKGEVKQITLTISR